MKFRNVCVFFVKCMWSDWFLGARSRKIFMKILFSLVCFQIRMPDTLHLFSVFIFYSPRICPIFAFSAMWVECCWLVQENPVLSRFSASHGVFLCSCVIWLVLWMVNRLFLGIFCRLVWFFGWLRRSVPCRCLPAGIFRFFPGCRRGFWWRFWLRSVHPGFFLIYTG